MIASKYICMKNASTVQEICKGKGNARQICLRNQYPDYSRNFNNDSVGLSIIFKLFGAKVRIWLQSIIVER